MHIDSPPLLQALRRVPAQLELRNPMVYLEFCTSSQGEFSRGVPKIHLPPPDNWTHMCSEWSTDSTCYNGNIAKSPATVTEMQRGDMCFQQPVVLKASA
eukprot:1156254-Pelagomonas_calceolata.AAC.4